MHFLFDDRIERYDLSARSWLPPLPLPQSGATALAVDAQGLFIAYSNAIHRYDHTLGNEIIVGTVDSRITDIFVDEEILLAFHSVASLRLSRFDLSQNQFLGMDAPPDTWLYHPTHDPDRDLIFGRTRDDGTGALASGSYDPRTGALGTYTRGTYRGGFGPKKRIYLMPDGTRTIDDSGLVHDATTIELLGSVGQSFSSMAFTESGQPLILRGDQVTALDEKLLESTRGMISHAANCIFVDNDDALAFRPATNPPGIAVEVFPLSTLAPRALHEPAEPEGLEYVPDAVFLDRDGVVLLFSDLHQTVFRWSVAEQRYLDGIALFESAREITYNPADHRLYMGSLEGEIWSVEARARARPEPFVNIPGFLDGLVGAGAFLVVADGNRVHHTFDSEGQLVDRQERDATSNVYEYNPATRTVYWFEDSSSAARIHSEVINADGSLGPAFEAPYRADASRDRPPIRPDLEGTQLAIGRSFIFDGVPLQNQIELGRQFTDMMWRDHLLISLSEFTRRETQTSLLHYWSPRWNIDRAISFEGAPIRIMPTSAGEMAVVTLFENSPRFYVLNAADEVTADSLAGRPPTIKGEPDDFRAEFRGAARFEVLALGSGPFEFSWRKNGVAIPGETSSVLDLAGCGSADAGQYSVVVRNSWGEVESRAANLGVGPIRQSAYSPGNVLVTTSDRLFEATTSGSLRRQLQIPNPYNLGDYSVTVDDVVMDRFGRIHVHHKPFEGGNTIVTVSTLDPEFNTWVHTRVPGARGAINTFGHGDISIAGDLLVSNSGYTVNLITRHVRPGSVPLELIPGLEIVDVMAGLDGMIYVAGGRGEVHTLDQAWRLQQQSISDPQTFNYVATASSNGSIYVITGDDRVGRVRPGGTATQFLAIPSNLRFSYTDMNLSRDGRILIGGGRQRLLSTNLRLDSITSINLPALPQDRTYAAWIEAPVFPLPAATAAAPSSTLEDLPFSFDPQFTHPDPDAVLTVEEVVLPPWLDMAPDGSLAGLPLAEHIGTHLVRLRAIDTFGGTTQFSFSLEVVEVNDRPTGRPITDTRAEDSPPFAIPLSRLFDDEETAASELITEVASNDRPDLVTATIAADALELVPRPDAFGTATIVLRAEDAGGLDVETTITVNLTPVADPPAATELVVEGVPLVGATLTSRFTYYDAEGDPAGTHQFQWFRAMFPDGSGRVDIPGANGPTYQAAPDDIGSYIGFEVIPVARTGDLLMGDAVMSTATGPIDRIATTLTITADSPDPSLVGSPVLVEFSLDFEAPLALQPTGTLTIDAPGATPVVLSASAGEGTIILPQAGTQSLRATYSGDSIFHGSEDTESHQVLWQVGVALGDLQMALEDEAQTFEVVISRAGDTNGPLLVDLTIGGSATIGLDYILTGASTSSVTIPSGQAGTSVEMETLVDNLEESDETITITLLPADRYSLINEPSVVSATILDDDHTPVANSDPPYIVVEDTPRFVGVDNSVLSNDTDGDDGDGPGHLTAHLRDPPSRGSLTLHPDGSFDYVPDADYIGPDSFTYVATDGTNVSESVRAEIKVTELVDLRLTSDASRDVVGAPGSVTHTVTLENLGPSDATAVVVDLDHIFPAGVTGGTPVISAGSLSGSQWQLDLAEDQSATLQVTSDVSAEARGGVDVVATSASVSGVVQPVSNEEDDATSISSSVISSADVGVVDIDATPELNLQNGLFTQRVTITNNNPLPLAGFRLIVDDLPADVQVYNAHGATPAGSYYVESNHNLAAGEAVTFTLEFFRPSLEPGFVANYLIEAVYAEDLEDPSIAADGAALDRMMALANGDFLLEFISTPSETYAIEYSHEMVSWHRVVPAISARASRTQWIDSGPPKTSSHPSGVSSRYYRVVHLPSSPN